MQIIHRDKMKKDTFLRSIISDNRYVMTQLFVSSWY